jgi:predicted alpha/beta-fold hydrolase
MRSCSRLVACAVVALAASPCLAFQVPGPAVWRRPRVAFRCARMTAGQSVACEQILLSFEPEKYEAPLWARNQHVNTIVGALFATPPKPQYRRERWNTPDGDFLDIDWLDSQAGFSRGVVLLYHGLESTTSAPLTVRQAFALVEQGFDVAAVCFRGCSGEPNRTPGAYHLGFTQDIRYIAETLHEQSPDRKIFLSGTSLGTCML